MSAIPEEEEDFDEDFEAHVFHLPFAIQYLQELVDLRPDVRAGEVLMLMKDDLVTSKLQLEPPDENSLGDVQARLAAGDPETTALHAFFSDLRENAPLRQLETDLRFGPYLAPGELLVSYDDYSAGKCSQCDGGLARIRVSAGRPGVFALRLVHLDDTGPHAKPLEIVEGSEMQTGWCDPSAP